MKSNRLSMAIIVMAGLVVYGRVSTAYFCGYDDFMETHRAGFEDTRYPVRIFSTTHFQSPKYRPLNRALTYLCWHLEPGSALPFRVRNIFFHLIAALLVYAIAALFVSDNAVALTAGLLFCLDPWVNQNITAAIFTNTAAYSALLASFLLFVRSLRSHGRGLLLVSLVLALTGLFLYESDIVIFGMMALWLVILRLRGEALEKSWLRVWAFGSAIILAVYSLIRHSVVTRSAGIAPFPVMVHNLIVYIAALLSPVDVVLAHDLFGTSLPPDIHPGRRLVIWAVLAACSVLVAGLMFLLAPAGSSGLRRLDRGLVTFLILSIVMALGPVLLFTPHASETYLYLPAALYAILLAMILRAFVRNRALYASIVSLLMVSFVAGDWVRNNRVSSCAVIAQRIMNQLPTALWAKGTWNIQLAVKPGDMLPQRYGVYSYDGIATIDPSEPDTPAAERALQLATGNERLHAAVVPAGSMQCSVPRSCFWISANGDVRENGVRSPAPR